MLHPFLVAGKNMKRMLIRVMAAVLFIHILELDYFCIEGCGSRFRKVSNDYRLDN